MDRRLDPNKYVTRLHRKLTNTSCSKCVSSQGARCMIFRNPHGPRKHEATRRREVHQRHSHVFDCKSSACRIDMDLERESKADLRSGGRPSQLMLDFSDCRAKCLSLLFRVNDSRNRRCVHLVFELVCNAWKEVRPGKSTGVPGTRTRARPRNWFNFFCTQTGLGF